MIDEGSDDRPAPPETVYKYVVPERVGVLANGSIRFTPPLNTNDIFEVRQTFELLAGPKMRGKMGTGKWGQYTFFRTDACGGP